jgi:hypothetical protein
VPTSSLFSEPPTRAVAPVPTRTTTWRVVGSYSATSSPARSVGEVVTVPFVTRSEPGTKVTPAGTELVTVVPMAGLPPPLLAFTVTVMTSPTCAYGPPEEEVTPWVPTTHALVPKVMSSRKFPTLRLSPKVFTAAKEKRVVFWPGGTV